MKELTVKRRSRLRSKDARRIREWMEDEWGISMDPGTDMEVGALDGKRSYIINGRIVGIEEKGGLLLTLHGIMDLNPTRKHVTVDMGAVSFLANGADVMAPGVVDADLAIEKGDIVYVRDEKNGRPLCVGRALMDGPVMVRATEGKAVKTLHHVSDEIWNASL
ncbi:RNA-binding protein [Thermoplasmatales archaeon ex4484_6]|nr:MAG: RNA-binding protein [Thermoplasmatales archaeon ex4484_6]RLF69609.1 MAG: RNA-binding protein [Thermoplasmata archaeon]